MLCARSARDTISRSSSLRIEATRKKAIHNLKSVQAASNAPRAREEEAGGVREKAGFKLGKLANALRRACACGGPKLMNQSW